MIARVEIRRERHMGMLAQCPACSHYFPDNVGHPAMPQLCEPCGDEILVLFGPGTPDNVDANVDANVDVPEPVAA